MPPTAVRIQAHSRQNIGCSSPYIEGMHTYDRQTWKTVRGLMSGDTAWQGVTNAHEYTPHSLQCALTRPSIAPAMW
jgi:hypothetical protein